MGTVMTPSQQTVVSFFRSNVAHVRLRPHPHRFSYFVPVISVDVDRLQEAGRLSAVFSVGSLNVLSFVPEDHGSGDKKPLREHVESLVREAGIALVLERIELVCMPRVLGSVFNPLSIYYCWSPAGLAALIYEVRNTFGQRHSYVMAVREYENGVIEPHECDKLFYVSPFMDMALRYRFLATTPGETLNLRIIERDESGVVLTALLSARRIEPSASNLLKLACHQLLGGLRILGAIHFEALRLWLKGHHVRSRPPPPPEASFGDAGTYSLSKRSS